MREPVSTIAYALLAITAFVQTTHAAESVVPNPKEALERCLRTQLHTNRFFAEGETRIEYTGINGVQSETQAHFQFSRDDDRLDISYYDFVRRNGKEVLRLHRITHNDGLKIDYQFSPDRAPLPETGWVWKKDEARQRNRILCCNFQFATALDGYMHTGGRRLPEYLIEAKDLRFIEPSTDTLLGVEGTTPYGRVKLWLDSDRGYLTTRASIQKGPKDLFCLDVRVEAVQIDPELKRPGLSGLNIELDQVQAQQIDGVWVPISGVLMLTEQFVGGGETKRKISYRRKKLVLNPQFLADTFTTDLPAGTRVVFVDDQDSGKSYRWDGSNVVDERKE